MEITTCVFHELVYTSFPFVLKSESERVLFNQFTMYGFPELMLVFAHTSFPFGFDARLLGLIVT